MFRIQTVFWFFAIVLLIISCFQVYDVGMDFRNYQQPIYAAFTGIAIIALCLSIFSFHRRRRQRLCSQIGSFLILVLQGWYVYQHQMQAFGEYYTSIIFLVLAFIFNICGTVAISRDIKLLENSSRLR